ncbi:flagellar biosynthetic protein FliO [Dankookia sp. GCM10030260]|uniref:flagellar biosynthetic protein FliO n=1 Tax=Dankookia sp. GCM10030260 TaxID=3273390 RepID=UPI0036067501
MILDLDSALKAAGALAAVLVPVWLATRVLCRSHPGGRAGRRLAIAEVMALDARRRLVLVRCDGRELLLLTGGGQDALVGWLPEQPAP